MSEITMNEKYIDREKSRYPSCIVWTPIPLLTWLFPFIGHMGIAMSSGIIRDFAGPYYVSEDDMAFGKPTKYWQLDPWQCVKGGTAHNLCCDNCHSHVAMALNLMQYDNCASWNMIKLCLLMMWHGKYVSVAGYLKTWLPFLILLVTAIAIIVLV
ncbi:hypothetical protein B566_EDAN002714 [Ephemera danica]|nr:hypothetical protein B566_EDAN002714 [Ephemera danica]